MCWFSELDDVFTASENKNIVRWFNKYDAHKHPLSMPRKIPISIHYTLPIVLNSLYQKTQDEKKIGLLKTLALYHETSICMVHFLVLNSSYLKQQDPISRQSTFKKLFLYFKNAAE
jgi:hypothetical protein